MTSQDIAGLVERLERVGNGDMASNANIVRACLEAAAALRTLAAENERHADYRKWAEYTIEGLRANLKDTRKLAEVEARELRARIASLEAALEAGRKWMKEKGRHTTWCVMLDPYDARAKCTCGLDTALKQTGEG